MDKVSDDSKNVYYQFDYDVIILFGHMDTWAEVCWILGVSYLIDSSFTVF